MLALPGRHMSSTPRVIPRPSGHPPLRHALSRCYSVEAKGLEPSNLLTASQALYQLSYAPEGCQHSIRDVPQATQDAPPDHLEALTF
jgi:hypothetical protein